ncbi:MAG: ABC transporter ATP-binding protein [Planctomycetes bacterium]|nr:ABC transporter ATP-binding protein [Planctomycetota bacterium]
MKAFLRIFKYIWPQWPRIIVVILSAVVVSTLLSLSFVTVLPLLKVMTGEEGLHNWIDRKVIGHRYGMQIYLPEKGDFSKSDIAYYLYITNVKDQSLAHDCGLQKLDQIIGAGDFVVGQEHKKIAAEKLLETLAKAASTSQIDVQLRRFSEDDSFEIITVKLKTGHRGFYLDYIEKGMGFLPRGDSKSDKVRAVLFIVVIMGIVTVIRCLAKFCQGYMAQKVVLVALKQLRGDAYKHVMDMPMGLFVKERPSDTISRIVGDTGAMCIGVKILLGKALREPLNAMFLIGWAMVIDLNLSLIFLCGAPFALCLVAMFGKKVRRATTKSLVASSQILGKLQETMKGLRIVKVYNQQGHEYKAFEVLNRRLFKQSLKISKIDSATTPVLEIFGLAALSAAILAGAHWMQSGSMDGSEFIMLLGLLGSAAEAVRKTSGIWNKIQQSNAAAERVYAVMDRETESEEPSAVVLSPLKQKIEFRDIVFTYPGSEQCVLKGVSLTVQAGHNVAIVGPNGSGKTTLINLIPRFYDADSGSILIDNQNIYDGTLKSLRDQIGLVTQDVVTFNDTIASNIAYAKPEATREEIIAAAKRAFAHEFIDPLPEGYDTIIGEHGSGLSGGQLQRIVIARAILKGPPILIFDEATSQVDADSEAKIHKAVEEIMKDRTSFVIAHRFSTIITADVIVVMDGGQIIAQGQHDELIKSCRLYQSLYETQLLK